MASINGITLKGMTKFYGHEGELLYQGNLYVENKKIAFWSQDARGAIIDTLIMEKNYSEDKLRSAIVNLNTDKAVHGKNYKGKDYTIDYDIEQLMYDLTNLMEDEKHYKNFVKRGYPTMIAVTDGYHVQMMALKNAELLTMEQILEKSSAQIEEMKEGMFKNQEIKIKVYKSLNDFNIGAPIYLKDIQSEINKNKPQKSPKDLER